MDIGQLFMMGFDGTSLPNDTSSFMRRENIGGAILFSRNIDSLEQVVDLNSNLIELGSSETPMMIGVDQEGGRVARLRGIMTDMPSMRAVGRASLDDEELPYRVGAMMARELLSLGFHVDFAPVVDTDSNPKNPVIGERSFGRDPHHVGACATAFIRGMQQAGMASCAKHFPGHGDTALDSHLELATVHHEMARLHDTELVPFGASIQSHVAMIMTAHVMFPALDEKLPATLSRPILDGLLRKRLGYEGVIVTDDLEMKGVADNFSMEEMITNGLNAGVDLFLICHQLEKVERAVETVKRGLQDGTIDRGMVEAALSRIKTLKAQFVGAPAPPNVDDAKRTVRSMPHLALADEIMEASGAHRRPGSLVDQI